MHHVSTVKTDKDKTTLNISPTFLIFLNTLKKFDILVVSVV